MRIVIFGLGRTGTTALYCAVEPAVARGGLRLFEPREFRPPGPADVLAKVLIRPEPWIPYEAFDHFDKKILLVRDPRDQLISRVMYEIYNIVPTLEPASVDRWIDLVQRKQADPKSVSVSDMCDLLERLGSPRMPSAWRSLDAFSQFHDRHPGAFLYRYEDYVRGEVSALETYLECQVAPGVRVQESVRRVERTRGSGDWKNWFTDVDVTRFHPLFTDFIRRYGYSEDWTPAGQPVIPSAHGSGYVARLLHERRRDRALNTSPAPPAVEPPSRRRRIARRMYGRVKPPRWLRRLMGFRR